MVLKEDKEFANNGKQMGSVRHQKPLHRLSHPHKEVEVRRGKRTSEARVHLGSSIDSRAETS